MCKRSVLTTLCRAALIGAILTSTAAVAQSTGPAAVREVTVDRNGYAGELALALGGSQILRFAEPVGRVFLANPEIGDIVPLNDRTLYVLGRKPGSTSLTVLRKGRDGSPIAAMDVRVGFDVAGLQRDLSEVLPAERIEVRPGGDGVILSGVVSSSAAAAAAAQIAERYAPGKIVNLTSVRAAEQVMLSVRVAEVRRSALQKLGLTGVNALWDLSGSTVLNPGSFSTEAFANLFGRTTVGAVSVDAVIDALERKGVATTLAEPTLIALSGETANFFAGGEFPVPVAQNVADGKVQTTIEFKQYGVSVGFTPTVAGQSINLVVAPEVSNLDKDNAIVAQGFSIPAITTRRTKTTVELRDGQSFAIAGLIRREFADNLRGLPGASKLPVFGALLRSSAFEKQETEVLIVVTARLAKPTADQPRLPTDGFKAPTGPDLLLNGKVEAAPTAKP
jgi:pilus assembly protein CpaC